ncbi:hypothetical protein SFRURICE_018070, partial [Spodoptera frugiperda]
EVWNKGVIWDKALGYHYLPLTSVAYNESDGGGRWVELEAQVMMRGGAVVGTTGPTGNALLLDCRFEPPFVTFFSNYKYIAVERPCMQLLPAKNISRFSSVFPNSKYMTARLTRWLGNWLPCNV